MNISLTESGALWHNMHLIEDGLQLNATTSGNMTSQGGVAGRTDPASDPAPRLLDSVNPTNSSAYMTASMFRNVTVPFICVFGGLGNTMAVVTLLYRRLRHTSCNIYLALRSVSDTLFLLTLMAVWFDSVGVPFFHTNGVCQIVVFISYMTSFLSVWSVVAITFENFIRICYPTKLKVFCTIYKAKRVVLALVTTSVILYQSSLWTTSVVEVRGSSPGLCLTRALWERLYLVLTYVDTAVTLLVPLSIILVISSLIIYSVIKNYQRRRRLRGHAHVTRGKLKFSSTPQAKVTRLLFAVSMTFLILHTPIHIIKLIMIVKLYILESHAVDPVDAALKTAFENMYYLNFSANFVVFFICGESFRKVFWELFCKCCADKVIVLRNVEQQTDLTFLNGARKEVTSRTKNRLSDLGDAQAHLYNNSLHVDSCEMLMTPCLTLQSDL